MNKPFVALLAAIVGMAVGGYIVAAAPPIKELTTYTVTKEARVVPTFRDGCGLDYYGRLQNWSCETVIKAMCSPGDSVVGGGYEWYLGRDNGGTNWTVLRGYMETTHVVYSKPLKDASGGEGWAVMATLYFGSNPWTDVATGELMPLLTVTATCLHRA